MSLERRAAADDVPSRGDRVVVSIEDDGPGIPPHALERIFERFYTDRPNHRFGHNSGLGLSISRQIVEAHGGRIYAENRQVETVAAAAAVAGREADEPVRHAAGARFVVELPSLSQ